MNKKRILFSFLIVSLLVFSLISFVLAAETPATDAANAAKAQSTTVLGEIANWWSSDNSIFKGFPDQFARILLMILVGLAVYSVLDFMPIFGENKKITMAISVIVSILGFMFVSVTDIRILLTNYQALGIVITTIIPLIIVIGITLKISEDPLMRKYASILNPLIIILFIVYLLGRWMGIIYGIATTEIPIGSSTIDHLFKQTPTLIWIYLISIIILLIWLFAVKMVARKIKRNEHEVVTEEAAATLLGAGEENIMTNIKRKLEGGQKLTKSEMAFARAKNIPINFNLK